MTVHVLAVGDRVLVYQSPFSKRDLEGTATLVEKVSESTLSVELESWYVQFREEDPPCFRRVSAEDLIR
jgi:hypothetical protein